MFEAIFVCPSWVGAVLLAAGGWRPGMLLIILHGTVPATKKHRPQMPIVR